MYPEAFDLTEVFRCAAGTLSASCGHALRGTMAHTCRGLLEARPAVILVFGMPRRAPASPCVRLGRIGAGVLLQGGSEKHGHRGARAEGGPRAARRAGAKRAARHWPRRGVASAAAPGRPVADVGHAPPGPRVPALPEALDLRRQRTSHRGRGQYRAVLHGPRVLHVRFPLIFH